MKTFFAMALLAMSLFAIGCNPTPDTKPDDTNVNSPEGGQPAAPGAEGESNP
jgi:hypothetical protein